MAKVVIVWNEHPTEVVAGFHARKVAKILKERYGHEVIVEKIPPGETNYGIVQRVSRKTATSVAKQLAMLPSSGEVAERYSDAHNAFAFNFHASEASRMHAARFKEPEAFEVGEINNRGAGYIFGFPAEITIQRHGKRAHVVEVPGIRIALPKEKSAIIAGKLKLIIGAVERPSHLRISVEDYYRIRSSINEGYHSEVYDLVHPAQQKYKDKAISEKIAAAIHERITRK